MKVKKRIWSLARLGLLAGLAALAVSGGAAQAATADQEAQMVTSDENAYVLFDANVQGHYASFLDGVDRESNDPLYNEISTELGITARKFYAANVAAVKIDPAFYEPEDHEFMITVMYYDYGPGQGTFHVDYPAIGGGQNRVSLIKKGTVQDWFSQTIYVSDMDPAEVLSAGGNLQLATNAYNLFKKVEIVNLSKLRREKKAASMTNFPVKKSSALAELRLISADAAIAAQAGMRQPCTAADARRLLNVITGKKGSTGAAAGEENLTQGQLVQMFGREAGLADLGDDPCEAAMEKGLTDAGDLLTKNDAPATNYSLLCLTYDTFYYEREDGTSLATAMIGEGYFDEFVDSITDEKFIAIRFSQPRLCPYRTVTENETGQTYYYMNIFNQPTWRPYVTFQCWSEDGKSFLCSLAGGAMFVYNTETQMLAYIDEASTVGERLHAFVGTDDYVYYIKKDYSIWRASLETREPEYLTTRPGSQPIYGIQVSNDCQWFTVEMDNSAGEFARYHIPEDHWEIYAHKFTYSPMVTHAQINPAYPNLIAFSHELVNISWLWLYDRMWVFNCDTGEDFNVFKQGVNERFGITKQCKSHELWSNSGEYLYGVAADTISLISQVAENAVAIPENTFNTPYLLRINKDGTHRQYYYDENHHAYCYDHVYPSGDDKFLVSDGYYLVLVNLETNQHFPISSHVPAPYAPHPYQAHPVVARNRYVVSWGATDETGMLGVCWFDFTELAAQSAKGGRYPAGENVDRVSYEGLVCESGETTKEGRDCYVAKMNHAVFLDVAESLVDVDNGQAKISFDYLDNGVQPLVIHYTSGVETDNDRWRIYDAQEEVPRTGTNTWKHCEFLVRSGNFEDIGRYETDFKIDGVASDVYISNIKVTAE